MVFLIQRTQNKESLAVQLKLNELVAAIEGASNRLIDVEDLTEEELRALHRHYAKLVAMSRSRREPGELAFRRGGASPTLTEEHSVSSRESSDDSSGGRSARSRELNRRQERSGGLGCGGRPLVAAIEDD